MIADETKKSEEMTGEAKEETKAEGQASPVRKRRGFAAMDRAKVREISRKGGVAAHQKGTAHRFSSEEARRAGHKGGVAPHRTRGRRIPSSSNGAPSPA
jgi:general stress protein YciG